MTFINEERELKLEQGLLRLFNHVTLPRGEQEKLIILLALKAFDVIQDLADSLRPDKISIKK